MTPSTYVLSNGQEAVLRFLAGGYAALTPLRRETGAETRTLAVMARLGLVDVRAAGALDPLIHCTPTGRDLWVSLVNEANVLDEDGPLNRKENTNMTTTETETQTAPVDVTPDPKPGSKAQTAATPAAPASTPASPKADLQPLYKSLLAEVKKAAGRGHLTEDKAVYTRVTAHGKAVAYINHPTSKSVRVEIPQPEGSGYDVVKAVTDKDVPKVMKLVDARMELLAAKAKEKAGK